MHIAEHFVMRYLLPIPDSAFATTARWRAAAFHLAVPVAWLCAFAAARLLEHAPHASLWFPPAAISFAAALVGGVRVLPSLLVVCAIATFVTDRMYGSNVSVGALSASSVVFAVSHLAGHAGAALWLRRRHRRESAGPTVSAMLDFLLWAAVGAAVSAYAGARMLSLTGLLDAASPEMIAAWWLGDYTAVVTLTPLCIVFLRAIKGRRGEDGPRWLDETSLAPRATAPVPKLALFIGTAVAVLAVADIFPHQTVLLALLMVPLVLQLWITYTEPRRYTVASVSLFSLLAVGAASRSPGGAALVLQCATLSLAANAYLGLGVPALMADNRRLREQLARDRLTGAISRASYEERAAEAVAHAVEAGSAVSIALLDLDGLKLVNDRCGHLAGDALLVDVVASCGECLRPCDSIARLGGDEFVVLLPGSDASQAKAAVASMQLALAGLAPGDDRPPVSASFGIATWSPGDTAETMLARADGEMYSQKRLSRVARRGDGVGQVY